MIEMMEIYGVTATTSFEDELIDELGYCRICGHYGCPVVDNTSPTMAEFHKPAEPCGLYICCVN